MARCERRRGTIFYDRAICVGGIPWADRQVQIARPERAVCRSRRCNRKPPSANPDRFCARLFLVKPFAAALAAVMAEPRDAILVAGDIKITFAAAVRTASREFAGLRGDIINAVSS